MFRRRSLAIEHDDNIIILDDTLHLKQLVTRSALISYPERYQRTPFVHFFHGNQTKQLCFIATTRVLSPNL